MPSSNSDSPSDNPAELTLLSVHDNTLLSYNVDAEAQRITRHTLFEASDGAERTDVVFEDVLVYHFEGDNFGTILFDIQEATVAQVYDAYESLFVQRKNYAWPPLRYGYDDRDALLARLETDGYRAFLVNSSYGMEGFVLAKHMRFVTVAADRKA